ncbi:hypothetical protein TNCV_3737161 [Trichonephila clavipes]|nr:hypothetical protein TNCV_3737161 [Trichonephila clavipes]
MWTTPELALPPLTTTPTEGSDQINNYHSAASPASGRRLFPLIVCSEWNEPPQCPYTSFCSEDRLRTERTAAIANQHSMLTLS